MTRKAKLEIVLDCSDPERLMVFWRDALGYRVHYAAPSLAVLVPDDVNGSPLLLQRVPEPKAVKNRMHVDIVTPDVDAEVERLGALGARRLRADRAPRWCANADPRIEIRRDPDWRVVRR
jgi:hypothetical protein